MRPFAWMPWPLRWFARVVTVLLALAVVLAGVFVLLRLPPGQVQRRHKPMGDRKAPWRLRRARLSAVSFPVLLLATIFAFTQFAISMLVPVLVPFARQVARQSGLSEGQIDFVMGAGIGVIAGALALGAVPLGQLSDRIGRDAAIRWALACGIVCFLLAPFTPHILLLGALGVLAGLAWLLAFPAVLALSSDIVTEQERGAAVGLVYGGQGVGAIFGSLVGGFLAEGVKGWQGRAWGLRAPFFGGAVAIFVALLLTFWLSRILAMRPAEVDDTEPELAAPNPFEE